MRVLAFDSTSPILTVGIAEGGKPLGRWDMTSDRHRGNALDGLIDRALGDAGWHRSQVEGLALVTGPGSLTAMRIGWATACGWALAGDLPITGWATAEVQWRRWMRPAPAGSVFARETNPERIVYCMVHHRGDEFYCYQFQPEHPPDRPSTVVIGQWHPAGGSPAVLAGPGLLGFRSRWESSLGSETVIVPDAETVIGGDQLAVWGTQALAAGRHLTPDSSPLDYGVPPSFRKAS